MSEEFSTYLYLLSALLQSDAAIIGFGAIFVVYKLQNLNFLFQDTFKKITKIGTDNLTKLSLLKRYDEKLNFIKGWDGSDIYKDLYSYIDIQKKEATILEKTKSPFLIIILHISFCSLFLWLSSFLNRLIGIKILIYFVGGFMALTFIFLIIKVVIFTKIILEENV